MSLNERSWHAHDAERRARRPLVALIVLFIALAAYVGYGVISPTVVDGTPPVPGIGTASYLPSAAESAFIANANAVCKSFSASGTAAGKKFDQVAAHAQTLNDLVPVITTMMDIATKMERNLRALQPPPSLADPFSNYLKQLDRLVQLWHQFRYLALHNDAVGLQSLRDANRLSGGDPVKIAADVLGLTDCISD